MSLPAEPVTTCYRHPDRRAGVSCQRCNRFICPACMVPASVGFQCPECVHASARTAPVYKAAPVPAGSFGGRTDSWGGVPAARPWVTYVLIALNVVVFVAELATAASRNNLLTGASGRIYTEGVLYGPLVGAGEWYRLVTSGFLHAGLLHIGMNMYVLYAIGPQLERLLGAPRYLSLYVASLLAGALGVIIVSPYSQTLGASGAIFGLLGAAAAYQLSQGINLWESGLGKLIAINVVITIGFSSFISVGGHLGGLVGGGLTGYLLFQFDRRRQSPWLGVAAATALALVFAGVAVAMAPTTIPLR